jgi:two-component system response regulator PilR (NtrC family)
MTTYSALIVDDELDIRELLEITMMRMGIETQSAATLKEAHGLLAKQSFDICLTDMKLPDGNGLELIKYIQEKYPHIPVAMITAFGSMELAINALKAGAFDFINKPIDLAKLRELINNALKLSAAPIKQSDTTIDETTETRLQGDSEKILHLRNQIKKLARSQAPIYINGESGSGKELVARAIHEQGPRGDKPFIAVNCGAIPTELMESEFFGHKKGSFTGATQDKQGFFQAAHSGTLFLDEVADLPLLMQVKLLRAIQEKAVRPVGAQKEEAVDVRILSATHKDLQNEVAHHHFRQDLFYRINVIELKVPALRERGDDIIILTQRILQKLAEQSDASPIALDASAIVALKKYSYPGNVRELENILERAFVLCENNTITAEDLQLPIHTSTNHNDVVTAVSLNQVESLEDYLEEAERHLIIQAINETQGNKTAAAKRLGMTFRSLRYRLKKLGLDDGGEE